MPSDKIPAGFDAENYRLAYPDVALSGLDPETHYLKYGTLFGRPPNPAAVTETAPIRLRDSDPAILDLLYAQGIMPQTAPVRHSELVTILMPSHNNEKWLVRAINSALSQQGVAVEVIVIDDGSTDGSVKVAREIAQTASNLKVISLLRNFGCYYARNVGVMHSKGAFITILDTDDIMSPDRIARQLDVLKTVPGLVACRGRQRRWTPDYTTPVSELKYGENSLLWRRDVLNRVGWYDTVRFSGDGEFRFRLEKTYGVAAVLKMEDEFYFTRTLENSLTTSKKSRVFTLQEGQLALTMSPPRKNYRAAFTNWHQGGGKLRVAFPQFSRPFKLGAQAQNASPSLGQHRIGTMESVSARRESLKEMLPHILPQLNELRLYLNDYDAVPDFAQDPKIRVVLGKDAKGDLGDTGKFHDLSTEGAYIFSLKDTVKYPADYVTQMIYRIEMLGRACIVGVHGEIFPNDKFTKLSQRKVFAIDTKQMGQFVDLLGTGAAAWHSSCFMPNLGEFETNDQCDLWFSAAAARRNIPLFIVPKAANWLTEHAVDHAKPSDEEARQKQEHYFKTYHDSIAPVLDKGRVRRQMVAHLGNCYDRDTLKAAQILISKSVMQDAGDMIGARRSIEHHAPRPVAGKTIKRKAPHFHLIVTGWNCQEYLTACLRSIAQQLPGPYTFDVTLIDDHSTDGTYEDLTGTAILPHAKLIRVAKNTGAAHARHLGITAIKDPDTIVVLLDMDDALEPHALRTVVQCYRDNPACLMTIGNWQDQNDVKNTQGFYTAEEIDAQRARTRDLFSASYLRTFRRHLYDAIEVSDLVDDEGKWLESSADAALMYPLIDQCHSNEVAFIEEPIYRHTRDHETGTLARFGQQHKDERLNWLQGKAPKLRQAARKAK